MIINSVLNSSSNEEIVPQKGLVQKENQAEFDENLLGLLMANASPVASNQVSESIQSEEVKKGEVAGGLIMSKPDLAGLKNGGKSGLKADTLIEAQSDSASKGIDVLWKASAKDRDSLLKPVNRLNEGVNPVENQTGLVEGLKNVDQGNFKGPSSFLKQGDLMNSSNSIDHLSFVDSSNPTYSMDHTNSLEPRVLLSQKNLIDQENLNGNLNRKDLKNISLNSLNLDEISGDEFIEMRNSIAKPVFDKPALGKPAFQKTNLKELSSLANPSLGFIQGQKNEDLDFQNKNELNWNSAPLQDDFKLDSKRPEQVKGKNFLDQFPVEAGGIHERKPLEVVVPVTTGSMAKNRISSSGLLGISSGIQTLALKGGGEMRIRLHPENLGELVLRIKTSGSKVGIQIQASDDEAKKLLEDNIGVLKESLSNHHLALNQFEFTVKPEVSSNLHFAQNFNGFEQNEFLGRGNSFEGQQEHFKQSEDRDLGRSSQFKKMMIAPQQMTANSSNWGSGRLNITA